MKSTHKYTKIEILGAFIGSGILFSSIGFSDIGAIILAIAVGTYYDTAT